VRDAGEFEICADELDSAGHPAQPVDRTSLCGGEKEVAERFGDRLSRLGLTEATQRRQVAETA
jgi:hypothetical protein